MYRSGTAAPPPVQTSASAAPPASTVSDDAVELAFWNSIGSSNDPRLYREYLAKYPNGKFASVAKLKLQEPAAKSADPAPPTPPAVAPQSNLAALRAPVQRGEYSGALSGALVWSGLLNAGETLVIQGGRAASGLLIGDLPRVPVSLDVIGPGAVIAESPSAANQFDRIVLRNTSSGAIRGIVIRWRVAK